MGNRFIIKVLFCTIMLLQLLENVAAQVSQRERTQGASMGVEVYIYLFDTHEYDHSIPPAYKSFKESSDRGPLLKLLRSAMSHAAGSRSREGTSSTEEIYQHY